MNEKNKKKRRYPKKKQKKSALPLTVVKGIYKSHRFGFGFVKPTEKIGPEDIFIPKDESGHAMEGDLVEVQITNTESGKGIEGKITGVLQRRHLLIGGTVIRSEKDSIRLFCPLLGLSKEIEMAPPKRKKLIIGDRVAVDVRQQKAVKGTLQAVYSRYLGHIDNPSVDTRSAVYEFNLNKEFPPKALEEIACLPDEIVPKDYPTHEDLSYLNVFTIDPETAKDFDDALSIEKKPDGTYHLGVHIADVSFFVKPGTALDAEASERCNSTYFPDTCLPMLPPKLADNLCSLKPKKYRLTISTLMTFDAKGELIRYEIRRSIIFSRKRFSYEDAKKILDQEVKSPFYKDLCLLKELALLLKEQRKERGCVDFSLKSSKIKLDRSGTPVGMEIIDYDITHQMIEEFMLKNNEIIARHLFDQKTSIPFRVHEEPKEESLADFMTAASSMGFSIKKKPDQKELQRLFEEVRETPREHRLAVAFIKSMKLAFYSPENIGHYGLKLDYYCHFTSPIRRYVDLIIHRRLFGEHPSCDIEKVCMNCSDKERLSAKAENSVRTLKVLRLMRLRQNKKGGYVYEAFITKIKPFGIFFDIPEYLFEGFLHISQIGKDYYVYHEKKSLLKGESEKEVLEIGTKITVKVRSVCLITQEVEWQRCL